MNPQTEAVRAIFTETLSALSPQELLGLTLEPYYELRANLLSAQAA